MKVGSYKNQNGNRPGLRFPPPLISISIEFLFFLVGLEISFDNTNPFPMWFRVSSNDHNLSALQNNYRN